MSNFPSAKAKAPLRLVPQGISQDGLATIEYLEQLLDAARKGAVVGMALVVGLRQRKFMVNCVGALESDPVLARGTLKSLDDYLKGLVEVD